MRYILISSDRQTADEATVVRLVTRIVVGRVGVMVLTNAGERSAVDRLIRQARTGDRVFCITEDPSIVTPLEAALHRVSLIFAVSSELHKLEEMLREFVRAA